MLPSQTMLAHQMPRTAHEVKFPSSLYLRARLLKRVAYRTWKTLALWNAKSLLGEIRHEVNEPFPPYIPSIILSSFNGLTDFLILSYLFRESSLTFIAPKDLPDEPEIRKLRSINQVLYLDDGGPDYSFFKSLLTTLCHLNRSVVISPDAATKYARGVLVDPATVARIAMMTNLPILPLILTWRKKCDVWIGKKIFVSPRSEEFRDIFFKRRGARKYRDLPREDLAEIGRRIFSKINPDGRRDGTGLS